MGVSLEKGEEKRIGRREGLAWLAHGTGLKEERVDTVARLGDETGKKICGAEKGG